MQLQVNVCRRGLVASCMHHATVRGRGDPESDTMQLGVGFPPLLHHVGGSALQYLVASHILCGGASVSTRAAKRSTGPTSTLSPPLPPVRCAASSTLFSLSARVAMLSVVPMPTLGLLRPRLLVSTRHYGGRKMRSVPSSDGPLSR